jgi:hypothetical protein
VRLSIGLPVADDVPPGSIEDFRYKRVDIPLAEIKALSFNRQQAAGKANLLATGTGIAMDRQRFYETEIPRTGS